MDSIGFNLAQALSGLGINLTTEKLTKLKSFIHLLLEANQTVNLTSITDYTEAIVKHIYDSLVLMTVSEYEQAAAIIDVGSGGGIPGLPLAICNPEKRFVSIDSTQKKIKFQSEVCQKLQINNFEPVWGRAEELAKQTIHREHYDLVLARAVAPINILAELTIPFAKMNGTIIFYKSKDAFLELEQGYQAITILGGKVRQTIPFELPLNYGSRMIIQIQKVTVTPAKYPRKAGVPQKKPL